ncbi:uncharacterized protein BP5553_05334 [Venustampulla echinocandica]|uniref:GPI anchored serine-threonine rich protein n=1 Tax=Venustampulla echinocandica TaxID=2656787 RepID=A0A370TQV6_9HELO|nr:uncharacterized protein BP5553_05334 [Venustampulla echinocandica]RDL37901.1 hypothetical protein BP5553_05334 [Venustampulla echinocandica]
MQFLLPVSLLVAVVAAQSTFTAPTSPTSTKCAAQGVLDQCITTNMGYVNSCATSDYSCLCQKWGDVLTCYLQCPNDPNFSGAQSSKATYCQNASVYASTTTSAAVSKAVSPTATSGGAANTDAGESGAVKTPSGTGSSASPSASGKSGADNLAIGAGSVMMGLAGLVAAVL